MEFWTYYRAFRRRRGIYFGAVLLAVAVAAAVYGPHATQYQASATLSIPAQPPASVLSEGGAQNGGDLRTALVLGLLQSRDLADRVVQDYHLGLNSDAVQRNLQFEEDSGAASST